MLGGLGQALLAVERENVEMIDPPITCRSRWGTEADKPLLVQ